MTNLRFKPTRDRILVEAVHSAPHVGAIHIPQGHVESHPAEAVVVAIGPANQLPVQVGSRVLTERFNGDQVQIGKNQYRLLGPNDLLAIVTD